MGGVPRYDRFMVLNKVGRIGVLRRYFTPAQRWCYLAGIVGTAADSPIRGWLMLTEQVAADAHDVADAAGVEIAEAEVTMEKAIQFGLVEHDELLGCLWVPDFEVYNPKPPKNDRTATDRKRAQREREAQKGECHADVTLDVTPDGHASRHAPQVSNKGTKEGTTASAVEPVDRPELAQLCSLLADEVKRNGSKRPAVTKGWLTACRLLIDSDGRSAEEVRQAILWCQDDDFWRANVLSMPTLRRQFDKMRLQAERQQGPRADARRPKWGQWALENFPEFDDTRRAAAAMTAGLLANGGHDVTVELIRADVLARFPLERAA